MLSAAFFSIRRAIKVLYHQFDYLKFIDKDTGEQEIIFRNYLIKRTIFASLLLGFMIGILVLFVFLASNY
jgi:hypothetical protein